MIQVDPLNAPTRNPETYPGDIPTHSYLLCGNQYARIEPVADRGLSQAIVYDLSGDVVAEAAGGNVLPLNFVLLRLNAPTMNQRVAVLSVGSNAAPSQLALKFESRNVNGVVPVIRARVRGVAISYSAHLNPNGYIPAAPVHDDAGNELVNALVVFLDPTQLNAVDDSEPNYVRVDISAARYPVTLDNGERVEQCALYRTQHGIIRPKVSALGPFFDATRMTPQRDVVSELFGNEPGLRERLGARTYDEFRQKAPELSMNFREILEELHLKCPDGLHVSASAGLTYGESGSSFDTAPELTVDFSLKVVLPTPRVVTRQGEPIVQLSRGARLRRLGGQSTS